tara:strand:- start:5240 stop:6538 length:1299 start_codon:yes stop_codon:yes gene_type:complete
MNKSNLSKPLMLILGFIGYSVPLTIIFNFYLEINSKKENSKEEIFYKELHKLSYFKTKNNPYLEFNRLELHPTTMFSLPKRSNLKELINNNTVSLDKNGYRSNPYLDKTESVTKCIVFLGSSAAFGIGSTSNSNTIPSLINKELGGGFRVYNLAVPSWNSRQELISIINFISNKEVSKCNSISSISFTGTPDIYSIESSIKNDLYYDKESIKELISNPEHFNLLSDNVEKGKKSKSLKFNLKNIIQEISEKLFGNIIPYIQKNFNTKIKSENNLIKTPISNDFKNFINQQIDSFIINQKMINNIAISQGGTHLVVLQPDLKNYNPNENGWWKYANDRITFKIRDEKCLNTIDLRSKLITMQPHYDYSNLSKPMSLKESIMLEKFKNKDLSKHLFFDNSHLTDKGNKVVTEIILKKNIESKNCFNKNRISFQK